MHRSMIEWKWFVDWASVKEPIDLELLRFFVDHPNQYWIVQLQKVNCIIVLNGLASMNAKVIRYIVHLQRVKLASYFSPVIESVWPWHPLKWSLPLKITMSSSPCSSQIQLRYFVLNLVKCITFSVYYNLFVCKQLFDIRHYRHC